ncbi:MAG TPA: peptidoglycan-binding protein [Acidimicrobiales bacterium]|nr:peptidoglycan-binding protein [Acidimicrobiales bacterium]
MDLPLAVDTEGQAVVDLQRRLGELGLPCSPDTEGVFGSGTRAAVEAFQHRRGLRVDGVCGPQTWATVVEAGFRLGDRFLYHRRPMLRGDDVADLQRRLSGLGFDTGRVDGIFGEQTARALAEFQRNTGLAADAIVGASTLRELRRVTAHHEDAELVSAVRDRERMRRAPRTLLGRRIALGEEGGLEVLLAALARRLRGEGAVVVPISHPDGSVQAEQANTAGVEVYLGLRLDPERAQVTVSYYAGYQYESAGGRRLADLVRRAGAAALGLQGEVNGMALAVLRETRMPAVVCEVGPASLVVGHSVALAHALAEALVHWVAAPLG